jgi:hypothetical protein
MFQRYLCASNHCKGVPRPLDPLVEELFETHPANLNQRWQESPGEIHTLALQQLKGHEIERVFKIRYLSNTLRVWLTAKTCWSAGFRSLAESPISNDRWIASGGVEAVTYPPVPDLRAEAQAALLYDGAYAQSGEPGRFNRTSCSQ